MAGIRYNESCVIANESQLQGGPYAECKRNDFRCVYGYCKITAVFISHIYRHGVCGT